MYFCLFFWEVSVLCFFRIFLNLFWNEKIGPFAIAIFIGLGCCCYYVCCAGVIRCCKKIKRSHSRRKRLKRDSKRKKEEEKERVRLEKIKLGWSTESHSYFKEQHSSVFTFLLCLKVYENSVDSRIPKYIRNNMIKIFVDDPSPSKSNSKSNSKKNNRNKFESEFVKSSTNIIEF